MKRRIEAAVIFLCVVGVLIYLGAKVHFFTRFGQIGDGEYLKQHRHFWVGMAIVGLLAWILSRIKAYLERSQSK